MYPKIDLLGPVSRAVPEAVAGAAIDEGLASKEAVAANHESISDCVATQTWSAEYVAYRYEQSA